jgi:hypothetical protein
VRDRLAAQFILQSYLEWHRWHPSAAPPMHDQMPALREGFSPEHKTAEAEGDEMRKPDAEQQR